MKIISTLFLLLIICVTNINAQQIKNYDSDWDKVEKNINQGLPASALEGVKKIYAKAKAEQQEAQIIKSILYITNLQQESRDENRIASIKEIEKEIISSKEPAKSLLNSYLAGLYLSYYNSNRYKLYDRTRTINIKKDDVATWGIDDFHNKISALYLVSISSKKLLQQTKLSTYDALINRGNVRHLRPTLYDLLAHRALQYFTSGERYITQPAYNFEITQAEAFAPAEAFVRAKFITKDSSSLHYKALLIYQQLLLQHLQDATPDALIDVDLLRLQFVKQQTVHQEKDSLYRTALQHIANKYGNIPTAAQAWYLLATTHQQKGHEYSAYGDTTNRYELLKAKEITDKILNTKVESEGYVNAYNLNKMLLQPYFNFTTEKVSLPDMPFRMLVRYKNISKLYLRVIPATAALKSDVKNLRSNHQHWNSLTKSNAIKSWEQQLPANTDLQEHKVEIKIDALPIGEYFILASANNNFSITENILGAMLTHISNISFVNNGKDYFVLNRNTGQPLAGAKAQSWNKTYDYKTSKYITSKNAAYVTDKNGHFEFTGNNERGAYQLEITHGDDKLFIDEDIYHYYSNIRARENDEPEGHTYLFTDRSIYRPGQTVFFKGIAVSKNENKNAATVIPSYKTTITLYNANRQKVDSISVTANNYGSFHGKFQIPQNLLNGNFYIMDDDNDDGVSFKIEEYKRPKFYVDFEKIKGAYKVNDSIKVTGVAQAYAGNHIDGATVKYRVVREARFPYPWLYRSWRPQASPLEITHGETRTNADGKFDIMFKAIPDLKLHPKLDPVFDYKIYADVVDISGETRSATEHISAGYKSLMIQANIPERLRTDSLEQLFIQSQNMAGEFEPAELNISIYQLRQEERLLRNRYWERPDEFVMTKEQYIQFFPNDIYDNENDVTEWEKEKLVVTQKGPAQKNGIFPLNKTNYTPGYYSIEISTKDKEGNAVKDIKYIELYEQDQNKPTRPQYLWVKNAQAIEPGEKTTIDIKSAAAPLFIVKNIRKKEDEYSFIQMKKETIADTYTATEVDRGGFGVSYMFVKHNRVFQHNQIIQVPFTNKELKIEYTSFRDKTLPGALEKWTVKISGNKNEKVAAEMMASMYDASLDQFYPHQWQKPMLWNNFHNNISWTSYTNFGAKPTTLMNDRKLNLKTYTKNYDQILNNKIFQQTNYGAPSIQIRGRTTIENQDVMEEVASAVYGAVSRKEVAATANMSAPEAPVYNKIVEVLPDGTILQNGRPVKNFQKSSPVENISVRKNFNETAFFFPQLKTGEDGSISFTFTMPEALTRWKFQALAHTKNVAMAYTTKEIITQKELMVQPNMPRFLREGDRVNFNSKIVNLSNKEMTGIATLQLFDAETNEPMDGWFKNIIPQQYFTISAGQSQAINFPVEVPYHFSKAITWRIIAKANDDVSTSDGEENMLPVLTNRMLVTETIPLQMRGNGTHNFTLDKLLKSGESQTLTTQALTVEYTSNPAWYAVQALPYMMQYPYDCAEQTWNKYYANALAATIANSSPKIKEVFESWLKTSDSAALVSNLQKNEELKSILLQETPWVLQSDNEEQQKKNIALLFDLVRMSTEMNNAYDKLKDMQSPNGGFVWFKGGPDDRYITQYIITGIGHLQKLQAIEKSQNEKLYQIVNKALPYLDRKIKDEYDDLLKSKTDIEKYTPSYYVVQYMYMRSFFKNKIPADVQKAVTYFTARMQKTWMQQNKYMQAMIALAQHRRQDEVTPKAILKSLLQTAVRNDEMGMYYKDTPHSWWWYDAPVERQALIIEAFEEAGNDVKTADDLKTWLLKNKETNNWHSTKATAEACYALLLRGNNWLQATPQVDIMLGNTNINSLIKADERQAGTGYFKYTIPAEKTKPAMGNIKVTTSGVAGTMPTWGGVYWQYFDDIDNITTAATPLQISKKLFIETNSNKGPVLAPVNDGDVIKTGDKVKVRIELRVDRDMDYVHLKDMRAAAFEPVNVLSGYKWQGGLGYYESTKDASTNFFFNSVRKGTYVFEYSLHATLAGNYSNGITTIQCMYAPEFTSHSEGIRVTVK